MLLSVTFTGSKINSVPLHFVMWVLSDAQLDNFINMFEYDFSKWKSALLQKPNHLKQFTNTFLKTAPNTENI